MADDVDVIIVGAGQAGLAVSHELNAHGVEHVVVERGRVAETWRGRWDSFCLVTPNWSVQLPGGSYAGSDPDGFMPRDDIVVHLENYAGNGGAALRTQVNVSSVTQQASGEFILRTSAGDLRSRVVVLATGAYQKPHRPAAAAQLPASLHVIDAEGYTNPSALPSGAVLVVGSGQTGCQISEELAESGRVVFLACGRAPWAPRRFDGRDMFSWVVDTPFMEMTPNELANPQARLNANIQATGHHGGRDLHYRTLQAMGVTLLGHFLAVENGQAVFAQDLAESVAFGDARYADLCAMIRGACAERGVPVPDLPAPQVFRAEPPATIALGDLSTVVFTSGFRPDYAGYVHILGAFDELGFPVHRDGASTVAPGLYFVGVHFLRKRKSSLLFGVGEDAALIAESIAATRV
jgi:putative flavoprotein involved in K+ transport